MCHNRLKCFVISVVFFLASIMSLKSLYAFDLCDYEPDLCQQANQQIKQAQQQLDDIEVEINTSIHQVNSELEQLIAQKEQQIKNFLADFKQTYAEPLHQIAQQTGVKLNTLEEELSKAKDVIKTVDRIKMLELISNEINIQKQRLEEKLAAIRQAIVSGAENRVNQEVDALTQRYISMRNKTSRLLKQEMENIVSELENNVSNQLHLINFSDVFVRSHSRRQTPRSPSNATTINFSQPQIGFGIYKTQYGFVIPFHYQFHRNFDVGLNLPADKNTYSHTLSYLRGFLNPWNHSFVEARMQAYNLSTPTYSRSLKFEQTWKQAFFAYINTLGTTESLFEFERHQFEVGTHLSPRQTILLTRANTNFWHNEVSTSMHTERMFIQYLIKTHKNALYNSQAVFNIILYLPQKQHWSIGAESFPVQTSPAHVDFGISVDF